MNTESTKLLTATCPQVDVKLCEERLMHISPEEGTSHFVPANYIKVCV